MSESIAQVTQTGFEGVVRSLAAGIVIVQDDRIVHVNPHAAQLLGRAASELVGIDPATLLQPADHDGPRRAFAALGAGELERTDDEYHLLLPGGRQRHIAVASTLADWQGRPALVGVLSDVSRQRVALTALRGSEERYRSMVESLNEGVLMFDAQARLKSLNAAAEQLLGDTFEHLARRAMGDWPLVDARGKGLASEDTPVARVLAHGDALRGTLLGLRQPQGVAWLRVNCEPLRNDDGALVGALLSMTDVTESRRVEEALRVSESTNRTLMDALADGVFVAQDFRFVYANRLLLEQLGYARDEFVGLPFERVVTPELLQIWNERFRGRVSAGEEPVRSHEVAFLRKDGSRADFELVANRTTYGDRPAVLGVLRDIAERKRAAAELEHHRDRLEELVHERTRELEEAVAAREASESFAQTMTDHQPTLLAYVDKSRRIRFANRAWLAWFGKTREEVLGHDGRDSIGVAMLQPDEDVILRVMQGEAMGTHAEMRGAGGRLGNFWIYRLPDVEDGEIRGYFFIATDVTEMRRSERRLQELNTKLIQAESFTRGIADNLPGRVAYWDSEQRCRFANRAYCEWFGKSLDQVLGKTAPEIFGRERLPERSAYADAALRGEPQRFESEETGAEGRHGVWVVQYIPDVLRGEVRGYFVLAFDITAAKKSQDDLEILNLELVAARDVAEDAARAKAAFLANMSHEIRTPMNVIIGLTHLMMRDRHDEPTTDRLGKVADAARHLLDIVNDILDLSKIDAGKLALAPVDFSVDALLTRSMSMVAEGARRKGLALTVDRGELPQTLRGDALRLSQVLVNLLSNAVKFTAQGSVTLRCSVLAHEGADWTIRFAVHDTGEGISAEAQQRLFNPFEQADGSTTRRFGGTGLGLSIARELAQLMGGDIGVASEPGRGSEFWFTARLQDVGARADAAAAPPQETGETGTPEQRLRQRHRGARVLLADDNRINQELATELLRLVDLEVAVADNGRIAFEMAQRGGYDLILMDMQMPEMDGLESTRHIRGVPALDATPIVAMTASAFGADRDACLAAGMNDHIGKPVNPGNLYEILLRWLDVGRAAAGATAAAPVPAPAQEPAPARSLPVGADMLSGIDGLDVARGLDLFAGQRGLYQQALGYFVDLYGNGLGAVEKYLAAPADAAREAAAREVHSMGGAAAALGATGLEDSARRIDRMLREERAVPPSAAELQAELAGLRDATGHLVAQLRKALPRKAT